MWIFSRHLDLHVCVQRLLVSRFLLATSLCCLLEYQLLGLFVLLLRLDLLNPLGNLWELLDWTLFSLHACSFMQVLLPQVAAYGLFLCHLQHRVPACQGCGRRRFVLELPLKLCMFLMVACLSYCSSCFYASYVDELLPALDGHVELGWYFVRLNGLLCGTLYFLDDHLLQHKAVWPLPFMLYEQKHCYWPRLCELKVALATSLISTSLLAWYLQANLEEELPLSCRVICLSLYSNTLLVAKLLGVRRIFGHVMLLPVPFAAGSAAATTTDKRELPLVLALDIDCLFGFQLQVAKDFYEQVASRQDNVCSQLFQLRGDQRWPQLRYVLFKHINRFAEQLEQALDPQKTASQQKLQAKPQLIRLPLPKPTPKPQPCKPGQPSAGLRNLMPAASGKLGGSSYRYGYDPPPSRNAYHSLCAGESLCWLIKGLVCICIRSLKLDKCGRLQSDVQQIFEILLDLESLLNSVAEPQRQLKLCKSTRTLLRTTTISINQMIFHLRPYLEFIIKDQQFLERLNRRK
ncbi:hypothetical protein KR222_004199 [Zaprionus bogoriensis]|nr:hypothetical protein KR222_004199 [Zaprionus bogoriensis]